MRGIPFKGILFSIPGTVYQEPTIVKCDGEYLPASNGTRLIQGDPPELTIANWEQIHTHGSATVIDFDEFFEAFYNEFLDQAFELVYMPYVRSIPDEDNWSEGLDDEDFG